MILERSVRVTNDLKLLDLSSFALLAPFAAGRGFDTTERRGLAPYFSHSAGYRGTEKVMPMTWAWGILPGSRDVGYAGDLLEVRLIEGEGTIWPAFVDGRGVFEDQALLFDVYRKFSESVRTPLIR